MKIIIDDREDGDFVTKLIVSLTGKDKEIDAEVKRLKIGDYVCGDVCVERKTIDDFCLSIMDGRIKSQAEQMKANYKYCYVLISGRIGDRTTEINENCILGAISSLVVAGLNVVCVDDSKQLIFLMKRIFERHSPIELKRRYKK